MNLSIFSSDHWRELGRALVVRPFFHLASVVGVALVLAGSWWFLQRLPDTSAREHLSRPSDPLLNKAVALVLGNSRMQAIRLDKLTHAGR